MSPKTSTLPGKLKETSKGGGTSKGSGRSPGAKSGTKSGVKSEGRSGGKSRTNPGVKIKTKPLGKPLKSGRTAASGTGELQKYVLPVGLPVLAIALAEFLIFSGNMGASVWLHIGTITALALSSMFIREQEIIRLHQALMLLPILRLVNLSMPVFFDTTLYTFIFIYGPLAIPAAIVAWHQRPGLEELGITSDKLGHYMLLSVPLGFLLGLGEYATIRTGYLIPDLSFKNLLMLTIVMVFFVGLVEEVIFRSILQTRLEKVLGIKEALIITSLLFGLMHSGYGTPYEILYTGFVGLIMGVAFLRTRSLPFIAVLHGFVNVFLFGIIPHLHEAYGLF